MLNMKIDLFLIPVLLNVLAHHVDNTYAASCKGSVIFHWRETGDARKEGSKNWTTLTTEMKGNRSKLSIYINPNTTFGFTLMGDCCWEVYPENGYKGDPVQLVSKIPNGFGGIKGHPRFKANSLKKIPCEK